MTSSGSSEKLRVMASLASGLEGTMARAPLFAGARAAVRTSSRSLPLRPSSSGPWHLKQWLERMGRTSLAKSGAGSAAVAAAAETRKRARRGGMGITGETEWGAGSLRRAMGGQPVKVGFGGGGFEGDEFGDLVGMERAEPVEGGRGGGSGGFDDDKDLGGGFDGSLP